MSDIFSCKYTLHKKEMLNGGLSNTIQSAQVCYWQVGPGEWGGVRLVDFPRSDNFICKIHINIICKYAAHIAPEEI